MEIDLNPVQDIYRIAYGYLVRIRGAKLAQGARFQTLLGQAIEGPSEAEPSGDPLLTLELYRFHLAGRDQD